MKDRGQPLTLDRIKNISIINGVSNKGRFEYREEQ
jgi:hypothetical protein